MLNPELDIEALSNEFRKDHRVRIVNVLTDEVAGRIHAALATKVVYELAYVASNQNLSMSMEQLAALTPQQRRDLFSALYAEASHGVGFLYSRFHLNEAREHPDEDVRFLHEFHTWLNSPELFDVIQRISGVDDIAVTDAQATSYRPGHFLTRHRDDLSGQERRLAYVFGFSEAWHPDWGGLLQFFEDDGTPRDAWMPQFNSLSLFDVRHVHSVTHIAPYAASPRLSITGWFRGKSPGA